MSESKNERRSLKVRQESYELIEQLVPHLEEESELVSNVSYIDAEAIAVKRGVVKVIEELYGDIEVEVNDGEIVITEQMQG